MKKTYRHNTTHHSFNKFPLDLPSYVPEASINGYNGLYQWYRSEEAPPPNTETQDSQNPPYNGKEWWPWELPDLPL